MTALESQNDVRERPSWYIGVIGRGDVWTVPLYRKTDHATIEFTMPTPFSINEAHAIARRVIDAYEVAEGHALFTDDDEHAQLTDTLRLELLHQTRNRRQLVRKYGTAAHVSRAERKIELLSAMLQRLGVDVETSDR